MNDARRQRGMVLVAALLIAAVYAAPMMVVALRYHVLMNVAFADDAFYHTRVFDVARGGSLGNPYLEGHQDAPRFYPELVERVMGNLSRYSGLPVPWMLAAARVVFPVSIFLLCLVLGRRFGLTTSWALVAAAAVPLGPSLGHLLPVYSIGSETGFLRYLRNISPGTHVTLFVATMIVLWQLWQEEWSWRDVAVAATALGMLAYLPFYYPTFTFPGVAFLALVSNARQRSALVFTLAGATVLAMPALLHAIQMLTNPFALESMTRNTQMVLDRKLEGGALIRASLPALTAVLLFLKRAEIGRASIFLMAFLAPGSLLFVQNVVTNRQAQGWHWTNPVIPLSVLGFVLVLQVRIVLTVERALLLVLALVGSGGVVQGIGLAQWEQLRVANATLGLDLEIPKTLAWLREHTPPSAVILASDEVSAGLPMFTGRRVFWTWRAGQYSVPESEVQTRTEFQENLGWMTRFPPFPVDYVLTRDQPCDARTVYRNAEERTCVDWRGAR